MFFLAYSTTQYFQYKETLTSFKIISTKGHYRGIRNTVHYFISCIIINSGVLIKLKIFNSEM